MHVTDLVVVAAGDLTFIQKVESNLRSWSVVRLVGFFCLLSPCKRRNLVTFKIDAHCEYIHSALRVRVFSGIFFGVFALNAFAAV